MDNKKYCQNCGTLNNSNTNFCEKCGFQFNAVQNQGNSQINFNNLILGVFLVIIGTVSFLGSLYEFIHSGRIADSDNWIKRVFEIFGFWGIIGGILMVVGIAFIKKEQKRRRK